jgi:hypothetical protein
MALAIEAMFVQTLADKGEIRTNDSPGRIFKLRDVPNLSKALLCQSVCQAPDGLGAHIPTLQYPNYWDMSKLAKNPAQVITTTLHKTSCAYEDAEALFRQTVASSSHELVSIEAIQSRSNLLTYQLKKRMVGASFKEKGGVRKTRCFHGTSHSNVKKIASCGFFRDYNTATVYGKGTYFARDASYSAHGRYSKVRPSDGEQVAGDDSGANHRRGVVQREQRQVPARH